jgi:hypothetical protein
MAIDPRQAIMQMMMQQMASRGVPPPQQMAMAKPEGRRATDYNVERGSPEETEALAMESYGDPRFGPVNDKLRTDTERELATTRKDIMRGDELQEGGSREWEGDETPTQNDIDKLAESPTDGNLSSFFNAFPKYMMELAIQEGGDPKTSPDQYAMDDEEFEGLQRGRSTQIEER